MPSHSHDGNEVTLVLSGGFTDEYGTYGPGDISIQETGAVHKPVADEDGECIVLAVNEGPIVLTGPVGRLLNMLIIENFSAAAKKYNSILLNKQKTQANTGYYC